jgi:hypothetical protein
MAKKKAPKASVAEVRTADVPNGHTSPTASTSLSKPLTSPANTVQYTAPEPSTPTLVICRNK